MSAVSRFHWVYPVFSSGQSEALKWFAWAIMIQGHVNTYLFDRMIPGAYEFGRLAFPLFTVVLAVNMARRWNVQVYRRVLFRLFVFGALAQPFLIYLSGSWRLNVLFTLGLGVLVAYAISGSRWFLVFGFAALGVLCEFDVVGVIFVAFTVHYCRSADARAGVAALLALTALWAVNLNWWAVAAAPVVLLWRYLPFEVPRARGWFYWLYPAHLAVISAIASVN